MRGKCVVLVAAAVQLVFVACPSSSPPHLAETSFPEPDVLGDGTLPEGVVPEDRLQTDLVACAAGCPSGTHCDPASGLCVLDCEPSCQGRVCGDDGCGGSCGTCGSGSTCKAGQCVCVPSCAGKDCGPDGCGGMCGTCTDTGSCDQGKCVYHLSCGMALDCLIACGAEFQKCVEGCAAQTAPASEQIEFLKLVQCAAAACGSAPDMKTCVYQAAQSSCKDLYVPCVNCSPLSCADRKCGPDGCGGTCGICPGGTYCADAKCVPLCTPSCSGKVCGPDGCGGSCGECAAGFSCKGGACVPGCEPTCQGKNCGPDGCGGSCGTCPEGLSCQDGLCVGCIPDCAFKKCGPDGCGGVCGTCEAGSWCSGGTCHQDCKPNCADRDCGNDGCDGICGLCPEDAFCGKNGKCVPACQPKCQMKACGPDGCGGTCGTCGEGSVCVSGTCVKSMSCADLQACVQMCSSDTCAQQCYWSAPPEAQVPFLALVQCVQTQCGQGGDPQCRASAVKGPCLKEWNACQACTPQCGGKQCGDDGCGGSCGTCPGGATCDAAGHCPCVPKCTGRECGPDGCGGLCGLCDPSLVCTSQGKCVCEARCESKECGPDGCGGSCGLCGAGQTCVGGKCSGPCIPDCDNRECGPDGCGGTCGECFFGETCKNGICVPGEDGCSPVAHPGCNGCACEKCVCGQMPGCCTKKWGKNCADLCAQCGGCGTCAPQCFTSAGTWKECGPDGCGGSCGECPMGMICSPDFRCVGQVWKTCGDIADCVMASCLDSMDEQCVIDCTAGASSKSQNLFILLAQCLAAACNYDYDPACLIAETEDSCAAYYQKCLADKPAP